MKKVLFTTLLLMYLCISEAKAQVAIGTTEEPEKFSILQLEGKGTKGLRMPQLTSEERDTITDTKDFREKLEEEAKGLVIYNKTTKTFQYWNGKLWTDL